MKINTKNILLVIPYGGVGGMERLAMTFYNQYKSDGFEVKIIKIIKLPTDLINFGTDEIGLSEIDLHAMSLLKRFWFYLTIPFLIRQFIRKNKITHSISFGDLSNFFSSLTYTSEYKIASIHALKSAEFAKKSIFNSIFKFSYLYLYNNFKKVVCISKAIKKDLILNCNFKFVDKLIVIYNPHDISNIDYLSDLPILDEDEIKLNDLIKCQGAFWIEILPINKSTRFLKSFISSSSKIGKSDK